MTDLQNTTSSIHNNWNCEREVMCDEQQLPKIRVVYLKWKGGAGSAKVIRTKTSYSKYTSFSIALATFSTR